MAFFFTLQFSVISGSFGLLSSWNLECCAELKQHGDTENKHKEICLLPVQSGTKGFIDGSQLLMTT